MAICPGAQTTGESGRSPHEQSLVLETADGLVIITGCAHPGLRLIVEHVRAVFPTEPIALIVGGFHLLETAALTIHALTGTLVELGVEQVAPTHCTGDQARAIFAEVFGEHFIDAGSGWSQEFSKKP